MGLYYFQQIASHLAVGLLLLGSLLACRRTRTSPKVIQLFGSVCMTGSAILSYLVQLRAVPPTYRLTPTWAVWTEQILASTGILLFAAGYAFERLGMERKTGTSTSTPPHF
jgi:hypothetical protein